MNVPEILAPVGGQDQLIAAVRCGADAVYLGTENFNARRGASNFGPRALADAARYCRERGVRLYVTVNTLIRGKELPSLEEQADRIAEAGVDAVILQDLAAALLFAARYPHIHRVASTQTAVHDTDGVRFLEDAGFQSFVLARELSLGEMEKIISSTTLPAEAFVHGAHCMCVSGMCLLSSMLGGRSGNRGMCAQPCRLDWRCGGEGHVLSLKDMSLIRSIPALARIGVRTLKIEGRMKRPEYVAAAVTACRASRAGEPWDEDALRAVFSRSGFTDGYLTGRRDREMFGYRTKEDVTGAEEVLGALRGLYRREMPRVPIDLSLRVTAERSALEATDGAHTVTVTGPVPQRAVTRQTDAEAAEKSLSRTGGTQYFVNRLTCSIGEGLVLPASELNAMRREALARLDALRGAVPAFERIPAEVFRDGGEPPEDTTNADPLRARFALAEQICREDVLDRIMLPVWAITPEAAERLGSRLVAELPAVCFPDDEEALRQRLKELKNRGISEVWADNIYGIPMALDLGFSVHGGSGLNIANRPSAGCYARKRLLRSITASAELTMPEIRALRGIGVPVGMIVYGHIPLMRFRCCPVRAFEGCAACRERGALTDRKGVVFPVECGDRKYSSLLNSVPLDVIGRDEPADFRVLWFTGETKEQAKAVIGRALRRERTKSPHTTGLYYRGII